MRALLILIGLVLDTSFAKDKDFGGPIVEVRAVFINCEPEFEEFIMNGLTKNLVCVGRTPTFHPLTRDFIGEREDISVDNEAIRFEREELFKHSVLQDCTKKMALTVKIATDSEPVAGDEYIPIEHVFQGQNKRVRLLNPYVLRLQRGTLLEAYKLNRIDTVAGIMEKRNANNVHEAKKADAKGRSRRSENHDVDDDDDHLTNDEDQNKQDCELRDNSTLNACLNKRNKRNEHNIVVENTSKDEKYSQWKPYNDQKLKMNRNIPNYYASSTIVTLPDTKFANLNNDNMINSDSDKKKSVELQQRHVPRGSYKSVDSNIMNGNSKDTVKSDWDLEDAGPVTESTKGSYSKETYGDTFDREFEVYEIDAPDLLYNVKIQLFEKLTSNEGNTLWNDMTKGEPASVSTLVPEWAGQDLIMRYHPMEWIPREEFTLPAANLCLLSQVPKQKLSETDSRNYTEKYIVVPKEDILNVKTRDKNASSFEYSTEQNEQPKRHVMIRTTRALYCGEGDDYRFRIVGNTPFLTVPHRRRHNVQIDLEARADENQLVPVGSSGRIMTVVSDSSRRTRTTLTVQVTNTGLAAAKFRTVAHECGPDFGSQTNGGEIFSDSPFVIPPRHTRSVRLDVPTSVPSDVFHCLVSLLNDENESVAVRDVTVKKGDRCFCVWHCECTCLSEDPKLLCREMSEAAQIAAGLSLRERVRHVRSICYHDVVAVDMLVTAVGTLIILLFLGLAKAILGLMFRSVGVFGLSKIVKLPRPLDRYYESSLGCCPVVYDDEGWPVHPKTKKRTVRCIGPCMELFLNLTFFITTPCIIFCDLLKQMCISCRKSDVSSWSLSDAQKVYNSSHDIQVKKLLPKTSNVKRHVVRRRHREMKKWMTPEAQDLSSNIWLEGLGKTAVEEEFNMQPLLHDNFCHCENSMVQQSCVDVADSEGDETEYVLMQIQKSKESLARSQRKLCDTEK